jgi:hypothetical protein
VREGAVGFCHFVRIFAFFDGAAFTFTGCNDFCRQLFGHAFAAAGAEGLPMPAIPAMSAVWSAWGSAMELIITGAEEPESAITNAAEQIRAAIAGQ